MAHRRDPVTSHERTALRHPHTFALAAFVAAVYTVGFAIVQSEAFAGSPAVLGTAVAADLTLIVPLAYWALMVRRGAATLHSLLPVIALSFLGAGLVLPAGQWGGGALLGYATAALELVLLAFGIRVIGRVVRATDTARNVVDGDAAEALERGFALVLGDGVVAHLLAAEIATLYYALFSRGAEPTVRSDAVVFSQVKSRSPALVWGFGLAIAIETTAVHLWLVRSHPALAWGLVALSGYSVLWLVGHHRAIAHRHVVLAGDTLVLRSGLQLSARVPIGEVADVDTVSWRTVPRPERAYLDASHPGGPNVVLTLARPTAVTGALGLRRTVSRIGLRVDDPAGFVAAVRRGSAAHSAGA
jgi:hypothetical protein